MKNYKNLYDAQKRYKQKLKEKRQLKAGICPLWKATAMIKGAMNAGATYEEAEQITLEVLHERGLYIALFAPRGITKKVSK
jgi:hypothetical protein